MPICNNCPRKCNVERNTNTGICGVGENIKVARAGLHFGEEPCISGTRGSGTIFFSGCSLKCVFCQNYEISHQTFGKEISVNEFVDIIKRLEDSGAHNINLVTPTHYYKQLERVFNKYKPSIPVIYNSSGYDTIESIKSDIFDVYLTDIKYYSSEKSLKYARCADYYDVAMSALNEAISLKGAPQFDSDGILKRGVVVRHLILPQNTNESITIIENFSNISEKIVFSLMSQYVPLYKACEFKELNRKITKREYEKVLSKCFDINFAQMYIQDKSSATEEFIPSFDLTGV